MIAITVDRARSFRQARRHTVLVRALRLTLPLAAVLSLASYSMGVSVRFKAGSGNLTTGPVAFSTDSLTMLNPRYEGFNKDGSKYIVTATNAVQDWQQQGPVALNEISGQLVQINQNVVRLISKRGSFDNKSNQLELMDNIRIRGDDGMRADLSRATFFLKESRIVSKEPVAIDMAAGQIRANEMELLQSVRQAIFGNGVRTRLRPEPRAAAPAPAAIQASPNRTIEASDSPVDVESHTLRIDDSKKTAVFTGDVIARQGEATLRTQELEAQYQGAPLGMPGAQPVPNSAAPTTGSLTRLITRSDVVLTNGVDRVTSNAADFDAVKETAILQGNVVVTKDRNVLRGNRLALDQKAGTTRLSSPAEAGLAAGRISARFYQAAGSPGQPMAKKSDPAAAGDASGLVFHTDPNAPIDIDADTLDVLDKSKTATFRGAVRAVQGDFAIRTMELIATYSGDAGLTTAAAGSAKQPAAQLQRVRANQHVEITSSNGQSATGDWAEFDVNGNRIVIGGKVALKRDGSVVYGPKAIIDMTTGVAYMEHDARVAGPAISRSPTEQRAPYALPDLPAKKPLVKAPEVPAFATDPNACPPGRQCAVLDPKSVAGAKPDPGKEAARVPKTSRPESGAPGWNSTTNRAN